MSDTVTISLINALATGMVAILVALINRNVNKYHKAVNGHMTELLKLKKAEGKEEQRIETEAEGNPV